MESMKPILLVGSEGFLGRSLRQKLEENHHSFFAANSLNCDLFQPAMVEEFVANLPAKIDVWFFSVINRNVRNDEVSYKQNIQMLEVLIEKLGERLGHFLYTSSVDVYGSNPQLPINESTEPAPESHYAKSKLDCEIFLVKVFEAKRKPLTVFRLPGIYGPLDKGRSTLGSFIGKIRAGETIKLTATGSAIRDFVYVDDLWPLFRDSLQASGIQTFNVAKGTCCSILDCIQLIESILEKKAKIGFLDHQGENSPMRLEFDIAKLNAAFQKPQMTPLAEGIRLYVASQQG